MNKKRKYLLIAIAFVLCFMNSVLLQAESCNAPGTEGVKYTADSGCDYTTDKRTCCFNGQWSPWNEECPNCTGMMYGCSNGDGCEQPKYMGSCPSEMGTNVTYLGLQCVSGKGWEFQCRCSTGETITFHNDYASNPQKCCKSESYFINLGNVAMGAICSGSTGSVSPYGKSVWLSNISRSYGTCQEVADKWWETVQKAGDSNGNVLAPVSGESYYSHQVIITTNENPSGNLSGSDVTTIDCSDPNNATSYRTVYCFVFGEKRIC